MFKIEKNIPAPVTEKIEYPFLEMEKGDSFLVPFDRRADLVHAHVRDKANKFIHDHGGLPWKFAFRREADGIRCWRVQ